jgi:hypothetical protein
MAHVIDWSTAAVEWTVDGHELSVSFAPGATPRQVAAVVEAVDAALRRIRREDVVVTNVDADGDTAGELLLTSAHLLESNPAELRAAVDQSADAAANDAASRDQQEAEFLATWTTALRSAP